MTTCYEDERDGNATGYLVVGLEIGWLGDWVPCDPGRHLAAWLCDAMTKEGFAMTDDGLGLGDGRETVGLGVLITLGKLVPFDLQQLTLALHIESLEGSGVDKEESPGFSRV